MPPRTPQAVCVILEVKPAKAKDDTGKTVNDYWKSAVQLMNERDFLSRLKNYDKDNIPPRIIALIRDEYLVDEGFNPGAAKKASSAAEGLCKWVDAMSKYDKVAKVRWHTAGGLKMPGCVGHVWTSRKAGAAAADARCGLTHPKLHLMLHLFACRRWLRPRRPSWRRPKLSTRRSW
jgi:hypothetical protein